MKIKIKVTKDVLKRSMFCGQHSCAQNCAIAVAVRDIFPEASVIHHCINTGIWGEDGYNIQITNLPKDFANFITKFDSLQSNPHLRLELPEYEFEIDIPESIIDLIGIQEATEIINNSPTLEMAR